MISAHHLFKCKIALTLLFIEGLTMYECFKKLFSNMPLAVLIGKRILGMHGGISSHLTSLQVFNLFFIF